MPYVSTAPKRRGPRLKVEHGRHVDPRRRVAAHIRSRRALPGGTVPGPARRRRPARTDLRSRVARRQIGRQMPAGFELARALVLLAIAAIFITVVLPTLLGLAAAAVR